MYSLWTLTKPLVSDFLLNLELTVSEELVMQQLFAVQTKGQVHDPRTKARAARCVYLPLTHTQICYHPKELFLLPLYNIAHVIHTTIKQNINNSNKQWISSTNNYFLLINRISEQCKMRPFHKCNVSKDMHAQITS